MSKVKPFVKAERLDNEGNSTGVANVFSRKDWENMTKMKGLKFKFIEELDYSPKAGDNVLCEKTGGSEFSRGGKKPAQAGEETKATEESKGEKTEWQKLGDDADEKEKFLYEQMKKPEVVEVLKRNKVEFESSAKKSILIEILVENDFDYDQYIANK